MRVKLILEDGIDDHDRGKDRRTNWIIPPLSQVALWLWEDGTVLMRDRLPEEWEDQPDDVAGAGRDWYGDDASWQVTVLTAAGYDFEPV